LNHINNTAYLCIVTWPNGTEGLLFPRPGNVAIADTEEQGRTDFAIAVQHLKQYQEDPDRSRPLIGLKLRLVKFQRLEVIAEHVHHD